MFVSDKYKNFSDFCDVEIEKEKFLNGSSHYSKHQNALFALAYRISDGIMEF